MKKLFRRIKIWHKILFTGIIFLIPTGILIALLVHEKNIAIDFARKEISGTEYLRPLAKLYRSACLKSITADSSNDADIDKAADLLRKTSDEINSRGADGDLQQTNKQGSLLQNLSEIKGNAGDSQRITLTVTNIKDLWTLIGNSSNLILDPDLDSYYLMDVVVTKTPEGADLIRRLALTSEESASKQSLDDNRRTALVVLSGLLRSNITDSRASITTAVENDSTPDKSISANIDKALSARTTAVQDLLDLIENRMINGFDKNLSKEEISSKGSAAVQAYLDLSDAVSVQLENLLRKRVRNFTTNEIITLIIVLTLIAAALFCSILIMRSINRRINSTVSVIERMSNGDITFRAEIRRDDEFGIVLRRINDYLATMDDLLRSIEKVSGNLSESSKLMSDESSELNASSSQQTTEIEGINAAMEESTANIESIANHSSSQIQRTDILEKSVGDLSAAISGLDTQMKKALALTSEMTSDIQKRQQSLRHMKSSMEAIDGSSREMKGIVGIISDISDQINLLSLNASIEAARAGEFGKGFAVVAGEISKLADSTAQSIKDIDTLIKKNDVEIAKGLSDSAETMEMIESLIGNVETISGMIVSISEFTARQKTIGGTVTDESATLKQFASEINNAIIQQRNAMDEILHATTEISELTKSNSDNARNQSETSQKMMEMSENLRKKLAFFKC
jgi:methyl-accepting chemotaxis protein